MAETATQEAAAVLAASIMGEAAQKGFLADEVAAAVTHDASVPVAAAPRVPSSPTPTEATEAEPQVEETDAAEPALSFDPVPDDELDRLLEEPDFADEAEAEVAAAMEADPDTYDDPDQVAQVRALEKKVEWLEQQRAKSESKKWIAENLRKYPLLATYAAEEVAKITATSRRGFAREAAALNARLDSIARPMLDDIRSKIEALRAEAVADGRAAVATSWGKPAVEPASVGSTAQTQADLAAARKAGDELAGIKALMGQIPVL